MFRRALAAAVLTVALALAGQTFVALGWLQPVVVSGGSMAPVLVEGQRVLVRRWATPRRWDVVVIRSPEDPRRLLVKRVVGLPGERVALRAGDVWVDGHPAQPRNPGVERRVYYGAMGNPAWRLGEGEYFVVGDNQRASVDSRNWGHAAGLPERLVVGVVIEPGSDDSAND
ncbi:signal peptidase I [Botrimarina sp.]|uniref:signal peptidase I n=1 Tax=Botrimarina sp. TaxID=2795802 RepID=UPI0032EE1C1D